MFGNGYVVISILVWPCISCDSCLWFRIYDHGKCSGLHILYQNNNISEDGFPAWEVYRVKVDLKWIVKILFWKHRSDLQQSIQIKACASWMKRTMFSCIFWKVPDDELTIYLDPHMEDFWFAFLALFDVVIKSSLKSHMSAVNHRSLLSRTSRHLPIVSSVVELYRILRRGTICRWESRVDGRSWKRWG